MDPLPGWLRGTMICLFGSTLTALGLVLQKLSHTQGGGDDEVGAAGIQEAYFTSKWWLLGFGIFFSAQIINMISMAMTPQVILSCLGSWTLVCNTVFAHLILGERVCRSQAVAVLALVMSTACVLYTAPKPSADEEDRDRDIDAISQRFMRPEFDALTAVLLVLALSARWLAVGAMRPKAQQVTPPAAEIVAAELEAELAEDALVRICAPAALSQLAPSGWVLVASISAGYTALLFKCIAEIAAGAATAASPPWFHWEMYALIGVAFSNAPLELHCLNLALRVGDAVTVVPMYLSLGMLSQLTTGAVFFQEFSDFRSNGDQAEFCASVGLTLASVIVMARARANAEQEAEVAEPAPADEPQQVESIMEAVASAVPAAPPAPAPSETATLGRRMSAPQATTPGRRMSVPQVSRVRPQLSDSLLASGTVVDSWSSEYFEMSPRHRALSVSVAGFGGAIECLDAYARLRPFTPGTNARPRAPWIASSTNGGSTTLPPTSAPGGMTGRGRTFAFGDKVFPNRFRSL